MLDRKPQILVVEDNYIMAQMVCELVRDCGFDVAGAVGRIDDGKQFLERNDVDGAIVDINLNGAPSFEICDELSRRNVPFFFLTAYERSVIPDAFRGAPLLTKPVEMEDFRSALTTLSPQHALTIDGPSVTAPQRRNLLLGRLDADCWKMLEPHLTRVALDAGAVVEEPGARPERLLFPIDGLVSLEVRSATRTIEVAMVGPEGMTGVAEVLHAGAAAHRAVVQFAGEAWQLDAAGLPHLLHHCVGLREVLSEYAHALQSQIGETAFVAGHARIEQRLARWLLMVGERIDTDRIEVTHAGLALALGVRRAGITVGLHLLEARGFIKSVRRLVRIVDRDALAAFAGEFYTPLARKLQS